MHDDASPDPAPARVRFSHITDDHIAALVAEYAAHLTAGVTELERSAA